MTDLERLTALILECAAIHESSFEPDKRVPASKLAGYLLANGVILPPCKIGDEVWFYNQIKGCIYENKIDGIYITSTSGWENTVILEHKNRLGELSRLKCTWNQFGKTVFLSREEAEAALERRKEVNTT